jgi:hypothetical protein
MGIFELADAPGPAKVAHVWEPRLGLGAVVVIDDVGLGPVHRRHPHGARRDGRGGLPARPPCSIEGKKAATRAVPASAWSLSPFELGIAGWSRSAGSSRRSRGSWCSGSG